MAYKRKDAGGGGREAFGNYAINSQYMHRLYTPKSDDPGKTTEIKVFSSVDPVDGTIMPQVAAVDGDPLEGISDAFHAAEFVSFLGEKKYQFVTDTSDFLDKNDSPTRLFYNKLKQFVEEEGKKREPDWYDWLEWGGGAQLPNCVMMLQGVLIKHNGEVCKDKSGRPAQIAPVLMVLSRSATTCLEDKLVRVVDEAQPISALNSEIGDITSPANGKLLVIDSFNNSEGRKRYDVRAGDLCAVDEQYVKATFVPWDKLLRIETAAWQIKRLVETFDPRSVDMTISSDPDYGPLVPENVRGSFTGKTFVQPAAPPAQQEVQQAAPAVAPVQTTVAATPAVAAAPASTGPVMNIITAEEADAITPEVMQGTSVANNPIMQALQAEKEAAIKGGK